jgi:hypothetical protein
MRWILRRRGEANPDVSSGKLKYPVRVMIFAGISGDSKPPLIILE